ncbi:MAG: preprotein translocase subunit SecE [Candidatus Wildermuthbacteria bacterium]|nr:preprotein translocase subunit SecE [Candidatus Wildermuthbacteria bacterium]
MNIVAKTASFLRESKLEISKVNWPSREQTIKHTIAVVLFSIGVALILGAFDFGFTKALQQFLLK